MKCPDRHDDDVVLVRAEARLSFGLEQADHLARDVLDTDALPNRIGAPEQFVAHGLADDADRPTGTHLAVEEGAAGRQHPVLGDEVGVVGAGHDRVAAFGPIDHRHRLLGDRRHGTHAAELAAHGLDVAGVERLGVRAGAPRSELSGGDEQEIAAELREVGAHLGGSAVADRHHGDDGADADDDAQHGEERPQGVATDRLERELDRLEEHHAAFRLRASLSIRPSTKWMMRLA